MKEEQSSKNRVAFILFLLGMILGIYVGVQLGSIDSAKLDTIKLIYNLEVVTADDYATEANNYYDKASLSYEQQEWDEVVQHCKMARDKFSLASQEYLNVEAEIKDSKVDLVKTYADMLHTSSEINLNMYEACEHFESASRYYKKYYLPSTPSEDSSFNMGSAEIENMNEKIRDHDSNVREYNTLLAKYNKQLKDYLE
jgi:hypothetical protein